MSILPFLETQLFCQALAPEYHRTEAQRVDYKRVVYRGGPNDQSLSDMEVQRQVVHRSAGDAGPLVVGSVEEKAPALVETEVEEEMSHSNQAKRLTEAEGSAGQSWEEQSLEKLGMAEVDMLQGIRKKSYHLEPNVYSSCGLGVLQDC